MEQALRVCVSVPYELWMAFGVAGPSDIISVSQKLFGFLLEYVGELATRSPPELATIDKLIP